MTEDIKHKDFQSLSWIAARLTHKLRNPLGVIMTAASQIELTQGQMVGDDELFFIDSVVKAAENLNEVLSDFALFAATDFYPEDTFDMVDLCRAVLEDAAVRSGEDMTGRTFFESDLLENPITGDRNLFRVMVTKVIENGLDAISGKPDGHLSVSVSSIHDAIAIRISDNGPGIPDEIRDIAVEPFVTAKSGRAGLGLAIAKRIALLHRGGLEMQSAPPTGTVVTLTFNNYKGENSAHAVDTDR